MHSLCQPLNSLKSMTYLRFAMIDARLWCIEAEFCSTWRQKDAPVWQLALG
jgi:hypothetical protein